MAEPKPAKLSPHKWILGIVVFVIVVVGATALGLWAASHLFGSNPPIEETTDFPSIGLIILGIICLFLGAFAWFIILATNIFHSDFRYYFFPTFSRKLTTANLFVGLILQGAIAFILAPLFASILRKFLSPTILFPAALLIPFFLAQLFFIWFSIWSPLAPRLIRKRLAAMGFSPQQISTGLPIGISDPTRNSLKKFGLVEEDMGLLWFTPDLLSYRGDSRFFDIRRDQLQQLERNADAGATSAYFGAVNIILHYIDANGAQSQVRLHSETSWTMTGSARALNELAQRIEEWWHQPATSPTTLPAPTLQT